VMPATILVGDTDMHVSEAPALKASTGNVSASAGLSLDVNRQVAGKLREYSALLRQQGESGFRSRAYDRAADVIEALERPIDEILSQKGREGLIELPAVGPGIAGALTEILTSGRWSQLDRLRGDSAPEAIFRTIPGIGPALARRLIEQAGIETLEGLEHALHIGGLAVAGIGKRRKDMIAAVLAERLGRRPPVTIAESPPPAVSLLLEIDRVYRSMAGAGKLPRITPRRFNPMKMAWLPVLHIRRHGYNFTALFSNSRLAHELGRTKDWVIIHYHRDGEQEGRCTITTASHGPLAGQRVVRGREDEQRQVVT